jgi:hypothetical protein
MSFQAHYLFSDACEVTASAVIAGSMQAQVQGEESGASMYSRVGTHEWGARHLSGEATNAHDAEARRYQQQDERNTAGPGE